MGRIGVLILLLVFVGGCASQTHGRDFNTSALKDIKTGTPKQEVVRMLGEPSGRHVTAAGKEQWVYSFTSAVGRASPMAFVPILGMFAGGTAEGRFKTVNVLFENNLVTRCQFTTQLTKHGGTTILDTQDQGSTSYSAPCDSLDAGQIPK